MKYLLLFWLALPFPAISQDSAVMKIPDSSPIRQRMQVVALAHTLAYGSTVAILSDTWYSQYPQTKFHFFNDQADWLQVDKVGHVFSAYTAGRMSMGLWKWAGMKQKQRVWVGGLSSAALLTVVEILDGFSAGWGFSATDVASNLAGSGLLIAQELAWQEQKIQLKFSFHRKSYGSPELNQRASDLFGRSSTERMLKDYNAQTYWLSANLRSFFKHSTVPSWLNLAVGYGGEGMLGGSENLAKDDNNNILFDRRDIMRYRQWYLAPDVDLTRIKTRNKLLKTTLFLLNAFKFPTPSLEFSKKGVSVNWIHF